MSDAATPILASGLCPACLFATAASMDDEAWPYQVLAPIEQDAQGITYLAERYASSVRGFVALTVVVGGDGEAMLSRFHDTEAGARATAASRRVQSARCRFDA